MPHAMGWQPQLPDQRDFLLAETVDLPTILPQSVNITDLPAVVDQGRLGSCTANAGAAAYWNAASRGGYQPTVSSRLFVYYNSRSLEGTIRSDSGATLRDTTKALTKFGAPDEQAWPYNVARYATKPPASVYATGLQHQALTYASVAQTTTALKQALAAGYPVLVGFTVYESFESDSVALTGLVPMPTNRERVLGGHAVLLVGYDTTSTHLWKLRNSWGPGWGDHGYFRMPEGYLTSRNLSGDFWSIYTDEG